METVTVTDVSEPNQYGYATITFADGTEATTKDKKIREKAFQSRNKEVEASISEVVKTSKSGKEFVNRYLNMIDGVGKAAATNGASKATAAPQKAAGRANDTQNTIGNQWAVGLATRTLLDSDPEGVTFPLTEAQLQGIKDLATAFKIIRDAI